MGRRLKVKESGFIYKRKRRKENFNPSTKLRVKASKLQSFKEKGENQRSVKNFVSNNISIHNRFEAPFLHLNNMGNMNGYNQKKVRKTGIIYQNLDPKSGFLILV